MQGRRLTMLIQDNDGNVFSPMRSASEWKPHYPVILDAVDIYKRGVNLPETPVEFDVRNRLPVTNIGKLWFLIRPLGIASLPTPREVFQDVFQLKRIQNARSSG